MTGDGTRAGGARAYPGSWVRRLVAIARHPVEALARMVLDLQVIGREHLPDGGYVIAANHFSFVDPVMLTLAARRNVRYLAVAGLFDTHHLFDRLISFFGAIPTPRDRVPVGAVRVALDELASGHPIGLFPEGRRVAHWGETAPRRGAAWLALATGVPIVPVAVHGTQWTLSLSQASFRRSSVRVWIGEPIDPRDFLRHVDPLGAVMDEWFDVVAAHLDPWQEPDQVPLDSRLGSDAP